MKHIKELNYSEESDNLFEKANVLQSYTGLPVIIWISPKMSNHGPRIKVQSDYSKKVLSDKLFVVTIEENPKVIGDTGKVKKKDIDLVIDFVKLNSILLLDFWNGKAIDPIKVINSIKKV